MSDIAKIELSKDLIEPIVRAQLQASIISALGRSDQLVAGVVQTIMNTQVDSDGKVSRYSSDKPLITWMAEKAVKEAALEAMKEWFADNKDEIRKQVRLALSKQQKMMAEKFVMHICEKATDSYRVNVAVSFNNS